MSIYRGKNCRDVYLASVLYDAIDDNNLKAINLLLEKGSDPNLILPLKGISSFHRIIGCDSPDFTMKATCLVLQFGGNPNIKSDDGLTPLHIAAAWGRPEILQILLSCGGDPEAKDSNNMTPIDYAMNGDFRECVYLLKSYLPVMSYMEIDQGTCFNINLDKVLVKNRFALGEYHLLPEDCIDVNIKNDCTNKSEKDHINDYIMNWFDKCENDLNSRISAVVGTEYDQNMLVKKTQCKSKKASVLINTENTCALDTVTKVTYAQSDKQFQQEKFSEKLSNESGIVVSSVEHEMCVNESIDLLNISDDNSKHSVKSDKTEYKTCRSSMFEKNIFEITEDLTVNETKNELPSAITLNESNTIAISEIYKYEDREKGIVLFERRLIKTPSECGESGKSGSFSSKMSSLPDTFNYDTDSLRKELTSYGFIPGPITGTTKKLYLKKLYHLQKYPTLITNELNKDFQQKTYSVELEKTRKNYNCFSDLTFYKSLEEKVIQEFSKPDNSRKWREGLNKLSFTYLLLDPRITKNLPCRSENLEQKEVWDIFLSAIFYVGKGKKTRPFSHLYEAVALWKTGHFNSDNIKLKYILDIWKNDGGVICLNIFHNVIPVEAYTREAAMIAAIKLENLTNAKSGEFYGIATTWPQRSKKCLGVYLLYKAMKIFLQDGERQIYPRDID